MSVFGQTTRSVLGHTPLHCRMDKLEEVGPSSYLTISSIVKNDECADQIIYHVAHSIIQRGCYKCNKCYRRYFGSFQRKYSKHSIVRKSRSKLR